MICRVLFPSMSCAEVQLLAQPLTISPMLQMGTAGVEMLEFSDHHVFSQEVRLAALP